MYNNPYFPQSPYMQPAQQPTVPRQEVVKVNGENGARAFAMGPNSSALLLDESGLLVWLVTTDGAGYKSLGAYDITPHQAAPAPDFDSLEARIAKLEEIINANTSDPANARSKPDVSSGGSAQAGKRYDAYAAERKQPGSYTPSNGG